MKKTKYFKPYESENVCSLKKTGSGVYIIRKGINIIYIGFSANDVKKTMYRHFQTWTDKRHPDNKRGFLYDRVTYKDRLNGITCRVIFCTNSKQAAALEQILILKYLPRDNSSKIDLFSQDYKRSVIKSFNEAKEIEEDIF